MTSAEHEEIKNGLVSGMRMMLQKMQDVSSMKHGWTMCEISQMADAVKDMSETYKNYAKANLLLSEHSSETF